MAKSNRTPSRRRAMARQAPGTASSVLMQALEDRVLFAALNQSFVDLTFTPGKLVADAPRNLVYLADVTNNKIQEINTGSGVAAGTATLAGVPDGLAVNTAGTKLYVAEPAAQKIEVFSTPGLTLVTTLDLSGIGANGVSPHNLVAAGNNDLFVTDAQGNVDEIDATTGAPILQLNQYTNPLLRTNSTGTHVYVSETGINGTTAIDEYDATVANGATLITSFPEAQSNGHDFTVSEPHQQIFRADQGIGGVRVLNTTAGTSSNYLFTGAGQSSAVAVAALDTGASVFGATGNAAGAVVEFNQANGTILNTYPTPGTGSYTIDDESLKITSNGHLLYTGTSGTMHRLYSIGTSSILGTGSGGGGGGLGGGGGGGGGGIGGLITNGKITGLVFSDRNADGLRARRDGGLAGFTVFADENNNGIVDGTEPTAVTDANGRYTLTVDTFGFYVVRAVTQSGFRPTNGLRHPQSVMAEVGFNGPTVDGPNFGETTLTQIAGVVFNDRNADAFQDSNEGGIGGLKVFLDLNGDGVFDSGDVSTTTDRFGRYLFNVSGPGTYTIGVVRPRHYRFTSTATGTVDATVNNASDLVYATSIGMSR